MASYSWNPQPIKELLDRSEMTQDELALATGISVGTIHAYLQGKITPPTAVLIAFADYFAVPLDYLYGRCSREQSEQILTNYDRHFMELRRAAYEAYRFGKENSKSFDELGFVSPWPYNLANAVNAYQPIDYLMTEDHEKGIEIALGHLSEREREYLLAYFKEGKTYQEIGDDHEIGRGYPRVVIATALKKLRYPALRNYILYGKTLAENDNRLERKRIELAKLEENLKLAEEKLMEQKKAHQEEMDDIARGHLYLISIDELDLSVRAYNCLYWRGGIHTYGDLAEKSIDDLYKIRNLGKETLKEIVEKFLQETGIDLRENKRK